MTRYIAAFLLAVGLIVLVIILIVRSITSGPSSSPTQVINLNSYDTTDTKVQLIIDGPVSANATHRDIVITVGMDQANIQVTKGYNNEVLRQQSYATGTDAYAAFLHALKVSGFTSGNSDPALKDERGQCALRDRFIYKVIDGAGNNLQRYWYTSCGNGTFAGDATTIRRLFVLQIPDYSKLTSDVVL